MVFAATADQLYNKKSFTPVHCAGQSSGCAPCPRRQSPAAPQPWLRMSLIFSPFPANTLSLHAAAPNSDQRLSTHLDQPSAKPCPGRSLLCCQQLWRAQEQPSHPLAVPQSLPSILPWTSTAPPAWQEPRRLLLGLTKVKTALPVRRE